MLAGDSWGDPAGPLVILLHGGGNPVMPGAPPVHCSLLPVVMQWPWMFEGMAIRSGALQWRLQH